jgi:hypothetical protein
MLWGIPNTDDALKNDMYLELYYSFWMSVLYIVFAFSSVNLSKKSSWMASFLLSMVGKEPTMGHPFFLQTPSRSS